MAADALTFSQNLAREAGSLLLEFFNLNGTSARVKADRSVVTEADLAADRLIRRAIQEAYPEDLVLTEENTAVEPDPNRPMWVIDPLDGTTNFSLGLHTWGVSIARLDGGFPQTAALYFPATHELFSASRGEGAHLNGQPLFIPPLRKDIPTAFFTCCSNTLRKYDLDIRYKYRLLGAAAYDFCLVARGAAIGGFLAVPKIWDLAAGWLVLEEAGGAVELHGGGQPFPYALMVDQVEKEYPTVLAANPELAQKLQTSIRKRAS